MMRYRFASLLGSCIVLAAMTSMDTAAARVSGGCRPAAVRYTISTVDTAVSQTAYANIRETFVRFRQGGTAPSCVIVRFSALAVADTNQLLAVRAVLDLGGDNFAVGRPFEVFFADDDGINGIAHSYEFIFPAVPPGRHDIRMQLRSLNGGPVRISGPTTTVHFVP